MLIQTRWWFLSPAPVAQLRRGVHAAVVGPSNPDRHSALHRLLSHCGHEGRSQRAKMWHCTLCTGAASAARVASLAPASRNMLAMSACPSLAASISGVPAQQSGVDDRGSSTGQGRWRGCERDVDARCAPPNLSVTLTLAEAARSRRTVDLWPSEAARCCADCDGVRQQTEHTFNQTLPAPCGRHSRPGWDHCCATAARACRRCPLQLQSTGRDRGRNPSLSLRER
jgi:hypothetical protein